MPWRRPHAPAEDPFVHQFQSVRQEDGYRVRCAEKYCDRILQFGVYGLTLETRSQSMHDFLEADLACALDLVHSLWHGWEEIPHAPLCTFRATHGQERLDVMIQITNEKERHGDYLDV